MFVCIGGTTYEVLCTVIYTYLGWYIRIVYIEGVCVCVGGDACNDNRYEHRRNVIDIPSRECIQQLEVC